MSENRGFSPLLMGAKQDRRVQ